jgi:hypothetical protein
LKVALLDVNVLVALAWPNHAHHELALRWFKKHQKWGWATCPTTQSGFVRVSSNQQVLPNAKSPHEALLLLRRITVLPHHVFWADDTAMRILSSSIFLFIWPYLIRRKPPGFNRCCISVLPMMSRELIAILNA